MWTLIRNFLVEDEAATAVEYCVMLALILLAIFAGVTAAGGGAGKWWGDIRDDFTTHGM